MLQLWDQLIKYLTRSAAGLQIFKYLFQNSIIGALTWRNFYILKSVCNFILLDIIVDNKDIYPVVLVVSM